MLFGHRTHARWRHLCGVAVAVGAAVAFVAPTTVQAVVPVAVVIVRVGNVPGETADTIAARHRVTIAGRVPSAPGVVLVKATDGRTADALVGELDLDPAVGRVSLNAQIGNAETVNATGRFFGYTAAPAGDAQAQYATGLLGLAAAQKAARDGAGVTVAVIDTGVQLLPKPHTALAGVLVAGYDVVDGDTVPDDAAPGAADPISGAVDPMAGHGTHVAGIVHLTAPGAKIMPIRVMDSSGSGETWNVLVGAYWAADHGATVTNLSLGLHGSAGALKDLAADLQARGVVVVAAAGNDGRDRDNYPAAADCTISVAASTAGDTIADFSTTGTKVRLAAPGEGITSAHPFTSTGYASWSGSSMAAPFAAGTAALLRSVDRTLTPGQVLVTLAGTSAPVTSTFGTVQFGRLDPVAAVRAVASGRLPTAVQAGIDGACLP